MAGDAISRRFALSERLLRQQAGRGAQQEQEGLKRQFASIGALGSGAAIKAGRQAERASARRLEQGLTALNIEKLRERQRQQEISEQRAFTSSEREAGQKFRTGERLGGQEFTAGERALQRGFQTGEREAGQKFRTGERLGSQLFATGEREAGQRFTAGERALQRGFQTSERLGTEEFRAGESAAERAFRRAEREGTQVFQSAEAAKKLGEQRRQFDVTTGLTQQQIDLKKDAQSFVEEQWRTELPINKMVTAYNMDALNKNHPLVKEILGDFVGITPDFSVPAAPPSGTVGQAAGPYGRVVASPTIAQQQAPKKDKPMTPQERVIKAFEGIGKRLGF